MSGSPWFARDLASALALRCAAEAVAEAAALGTSPSLRSPIRPGTSASLVRAAEAAAAEAAAAEAARSCRTTLASRLHRLELRRLVRAYDRSWWFAYHVRPREA